MKCVLGNHCGTIGNDFDSSHLHISHTCAHHIYLHSWLMSTSTTSFVQLLSTHSTVPTTVRQLFSIKLSAYWPLANSIHWQSN